MIFAYQKPLTGKTIGVMLGAFAPLHQGHLDGIMRAKKENDGGCIIIVCGGEGDKGEPVDLPFKKRYRYVRELFSKDDLVAVYGINDTECRIPDYPHGWELWLEEFYRIAKIGITNVGNTKFIFYVGEKEYYDKLLELGENAILMDRKENPISATMIRANPIACWNKISLPFRRVFSTNILITGTASEGKSTLVQDLGKYFNAPASYEWARNYMAESCVNDNELDSADYLAFLQGQYELNKSLINSSANNGVFFADTDSIVTQMYAKHYAQDPTCALTQAEYEQIAITAEELTRKSRWDKIFLLAPHGKFIDDHTRYMLHSEMEEREKLFGILCDLITKSDNWDKVVVLKGNYYENFITIVNYVKGVIEHGKG
jgi:HTH-type transcriptional repressor of NAD biosynthesis genes